MFSTQTMLVHIAVPVGVLSTGDLTGTVLAANDIVNLQKFILLSYSIS